MNCRLCPSKGINPPQKTYVRLLLGKLEVPVCRECLEEWNLAEAEYRQRVSEVARPWAQHIDECRKTTGDGKRTGCQHRAPSCDEGRMLYANYRKIKDGKS